MRTFVYVDGFNLYYGALKGTPFKWLDLVALFGKVLQPRHDILKVKYFTARGRERPPTGGSCSARTCIFAPFDTTGPRSRYISGIS